MSRQKSILPSYLRHKRTNKGRARWKGKTLDLPGEYGSPESIAAYQHVLANFKSTGMLRLDTDSMSVKEAIDIFVRWFDSEYESPGERRNIRIGLRQLGELYGSLPISEFRAMDLMNLRQVWIDKGLSRTTVVKYHHYTLRCFRHAVVIESYDAAAMKRLENVPTIKKAQGKAKEPVKIVPVDQKFVDKILPYLGVRLRAMVQVQRLAGMRPEEVCNMTWGQIDTSEDVWWYQPVRHKKKEAGRIRDIGLGPKAQAILEAYKGRGPDRAIFSATDAWYERAEDRRYESSIPLPSTYHDPSRYDPERDFYCVGSYRRAIHRACDRAGIPRWSPNRLRHAAATEISKTFSDEGARDVLGHAKIDVTMNYIQRNRERIREIMMRIG